MRNTSFLQVLKASVKNNLLFYCVWDVIFHPGRYNRQMNNIHLHKEVIHIKDTTVYPKHKDIFYSKQTISVHGFHFKICLKYCLILCTIQKTSKHKKQHTALADIKKCLTMWREYCFHVGLIHWNPEKIRWIRWHPVGDIQTFTTSLPFYLNSETLRSKDNAELTFCHSSAYSSASHLLRKWQTALHLDPQYLPVQHKMNNVPKRILYVLLNIFSALMFFKDLQFSDQYCSTLLKNQTNKKNKIT